MLFFVVFFRPDAHAQNCTDKDSRLLDSIAAALQEQINAGLSSKNHISVLRNDGSFILKGAVSTLSQRKKAMAKCANLIPLPEDSSGLSPACKSEVFIRAGNSK